MSTPDANDRMLADALAECERLRTENRELRERLGINIHEPSSPIVSVQVSFAAKGAVTHKSTVEEKVALFRSLFRGRDDVHAVRWEGRNGKAGYSPACRKGWGHSFQHHPDQPKEYFPLAVFTAFTITNAKLSCTIMWMAVSRSSPKCTPSACAVTKRLVTKFKMNLPEYFRPEVTVQLRIQSS